MSIRCVVLAAVSLLVHSGWSTDNKTQPNIVVILADDVGYSDVGCYGGEIETPTLDSLARNGIRFSQFYNTARCCPTRASLLTGLYPHQAGVGHMMENRGAEGYRGDLNRRCMTIAEVLRPVGYRNYAVGKWHVTPGPGPRRTPDTHNWPLQRGFDRYYGTINGAGSFFDPSGLVRDNTLITAFSDPGYKPDEYYYTDAIAEHAVTFIRDHAREHGTKPFFMYVAFTAAHWPLHAKSRDIAKYQGRYDGGYEPTRAARLERQERMGLVKKEWRHTPAAENWDEVKDKAFETRCMEVYAAQIDCMDQGIARIVSQLRADGMLENTLILFLQDNGACAEPVGRGGKAVAKPAGPTLPPMDPADQQYGSQPKQTREGWPVRSGYGVLPGGRDTFIAYGRGWANVSNTPFREYKHWTHEGGISTPLIAHWPSGIAPSLKNKLHNEPGHLVDIMATCIDLAGASYPELRDGEKIKPLQGVSLRPAFEGKRIQRKDPLFWEHEGNRAVRQGKWKLVSKEGQPWELYDMDADRTEQRNVADDHPGKVQELAAQWDAYAARADVLPLGTWRGKEAAASGSSSNQSRFVLKQGDHLDRREAPAVAGKGFSITATFDLKGARDGVIVAQGGSSLGYALYCSGGNLVFAVRNRSGLARVESHLESNGSHTAVAALYPSGSLGLSIDGKKVGTTAGKGLIGSMPIDGLDVGSDEAGAVGEYEGANEFRGTIQNVTIELGTN